MVQVCDWLLCLAKPADVSVTLDMANEQMAHRGVMWRNTQDNKNETNRHEGSTDGTSTWDEEKVDHMKTGREHASAVACISCALLPSHSTKEVIIECGFICQDKWRREILSSGCSCQWYFKKSYLVHITMSPPVWAKMGKGKKRRRVGVKEKTGVGGVEQEVGEQKERWDIQSIDKEWGRAQSKEKEMGIKGKEGSKVTKKGAGGRREHRGEKRGGEERMESCCTHSCIPCCYCTATVVGMLIHSGLQRLSLCLQPLRCVVCVCVAAWSV